ncbi:Sodium/calcium exchanger 1 [Portunus trituberculatus]|uniref:Sodium/calcium exchanger 1 n=1 Tax=Portunus trituberculatus TaxID=210409 RepID=A0A5B7D522_PORTR|nr:Sodium/calcium exchanger 1 [Portunus trituberculatus]
MSCLECSFCAYLDHDTAFLFSIFFTSAHVGGGYVCFVVAISLIGVLTAVIGDVANHVGCTIYLKDSVTATTIVALGTSMPASKTPYTQLTPLTDRQGGWSCFVVSIVGIGFLTSLIGDIASHFGCTINLKDSVTAISIVALGTSVPDTFASKVAAQQDPYADASIGNVTGSNAVNVFLGIGIAWTMAAIYHNVQGRNFEVLPGNLAFSVTLFCAEALVAIIVMMVRRHPKIGGELGGPKVPKIVTSSFLVFLWIFYVLMSTLEAYGFIPSISTTK